MNKYDEYLNTGGAMLYDGVAKGIQDVCEKHPEIGIPMAKFWAGEISWEEQVDIISNLFDKRIEEKLKNIK